MIWALLGVATLAACELMRRLPVMQQFQRATGTASKASRLIANPAVSDHWKERVLPRYAARLALASLSTFGLVLIACSAFLVLVALDALLGLGILSRMLSWSGMAWISAIAVVYLAVAGWWTRKDAASKHAEISAVDAPGYSFAARSLHRLALGLPRHGELLFDLESATAPKPPASAEMGQHVFVVGLARAGTTVLMRAIYDSGSFASLTYRDMPFVMAPNLWARLSGRSRREIARTERAHGDRVLVNFDSPEALEEPFWRTFCAADFIKPDDLRPHDVGADTLGKYRSFVDHVLARYGHARYLAKNNNGILRLRSLRRAFPNSVTLIPFREPLAQSFSLHKQHERFSQNADVFTSDYMSWLAHHEFGKHQRPFVVDGSRPVGASDTIDYWLSMWVSVHRYLLSQAESAGASIVPVAYEDLCAADRAAWPAICRVIGIAPRPMNFVAGNAEAPSPRDPELLAEAASLYTSLRMLSRARLQMGTHADAS